MRLQVLAFLFSFYSVAAFASVPPGCAECLAECPHETKDLKACDRGCPGLCSKAQTDEYKQTKKEEPAADACYACMVQCPHVTRDLKDCDTGCEKSCDRNGLRRAFVRARAEALKCSATSVTEKPVISPTRVR